MLPKPRVLYGALIAGTILTIANPVAAHPHHFEGEIYIDLIQTAIPGAAKPNYHLEVTSYFGDIVTTPDGHQFSSEPGAVVRDLSTMTLPEILDLVEGDWSIETRLASVQTYEFSIGQINPSDLFTSEPFVVSPTDRSLLGDEILFDWAYPNGVGEPDTHWVSQAKGLKEAKVEVALSTAGASEALVRVMHYPGHNEATFSLYGGTSDRLTDVVSPVSTEEEFPLFGFNVEFTFINRSSPIVISSTRVPEPSSLLITAFGALLCFSRRSKLRLK